MNRGVHRFPAFGENTHTTIRIIISPVPLSLVPSLLPAAMVSRAVLLSRVLCAVAALYCITALVFAPGSVRLATEAETRSFPLLWTSQLEKEHNIRPGEEDQDVRRRALRTAGVPGEGLLLAVANSDEDAIDEFGHDEQQVFLPMSHKDIFPLNRYAPSPCSRLLQKCDMPPPPLRPGLFLLRARGSGMYAQGCLCSAPRTATLYLEARTSLSHVLDS